MPTDGQGLRGRPQASGLLGEIGSKVVVTLSDGRNQGVSLFEGHRAIKHHSRRRLSRKIDRGYFDLLPYIEQANLHRASFVPKDPGGDNQNRGTTYPTYSHWTPALLATPPPRTSAVGCPADPTIAGGTLAITPITYVANGQVLDFFWVQGMVDATGRGGYAKYPSSIKDGTSNTIMITERYHYCPNSPFATYHTWNWCPG